MELLRVAEGQVAPSRTSRGNAAVYPRESVQYYFGLFSFAQHCSREWTAFDVPTLPGCRFPSKKMLSSCQCFFSPCLTSVAEASEPGICNSAAAFSRPDHSYAGIGRIRMFHKSHVCPVVRSVLLSDLHSFSRKIDKWCVFESNCDLTLWWTFTIALHIFLSSVSTEGMRVKVTVNNVLVCSVIHCHYINSRPADQTEQQWVQDWTAGDRKCRWWSETMNLLWAPK